MNALKPTSVGVLRHYVVRESERRTLRAVAAEIGMSHSGLFSFLQGGEPRPATLKKLQQWYMRHRADIESAHAASAKVALDVLLEGVAEDRQQGVRAQILSAVRAAYEQSGLPIPEWMQD